MVRRKVTTDVDAHGDDGDGDGGNVHDGDNDNDEAVLERRNEGVWTVLVAMASGGLQKLLWKSCRRVQEVGKTRARTGLQAIKSDN